MNTEILKNAFIPESEWDNCYISDDGMIFTPRYDDKGIMLKTVNKHTASIWKR